MQNAAHLSPTSQPDWSRVVKPLLNFIERQLCSIARRLQTGDPAATVDRLFNSQHVKDLRLIVAVALQRWCLFLSLALS